MLSRKGSFPTTNWTVVEKAQNGKPEELLQVYQDPAIQFLMSRGLSQADADDAWQEFVLTQLKKRDWFSGAKQSEGRFRPYLKAALSHFLIDRFRRQSGRSKVYDGRHLSLETCSQQSSQQDDPQCLFDKLCATQLLHRAISWTRDQYVKENKQHIFDVLRETSFHPPYDEVAEKLGMDAKRVSTIAIMIRKRIAAVLDDEIRKTLADPTDEMIKEEKKSLGSALLAGA
jgi:RNA polymerase sigma factor (sigma-70 family)